MATFCLYVSVCLSVCLKTTSVRVIEFADSLLYYISLGLMKFDKYSKHLRGLKKYKSVFHVGPISFNAN